MATEKLTGNKRSFEEMQDVDSEDTVDQEVKPTTISNKRRKIYIENNIVIGIDTWDDDNEIRKEIEELTKELSSNKDDQFNSKTVLIYNIDPIIDRCDIIDLCKDIAFPDAINYFRGSSGKAWLIFKNHQIALKIVKKLNKTKLEEKELIVGLIELIPKCIDFKQTLREYNIAKNIAYPVDTSKLLKKKKLQQKRKQNRKKSKRNKQKTKKVDDNKKSSSSKKKQKKTNNKTKSKSKQIEVTNAEPLDEADEDMLAFIE